MRNQDITYMQTDCILKYSRRKKITAAETSDIFQKLRVVVEGDR